MEHITEHNLRMALTLNNISIDRYPLDIYTYYSMTNSIPLDYISDHPPLAGKLLYLGQEINFISWNIMQGIGGVNMHGAIPPAMEANRTRLIYEYLNNLLRIPDLDVIFLQEADHRILGNILGTWGVIYNTENKPGIVTYYNMHTLNMKGFTVEMPTLTTQEQKIALALNLNFQGNILNLTNVHFKIGEGRSIKNNIPELLTSAIDNYINYSNATVIIGDTNIKSTNNKLVDDLKSPTHGISIKQYLQTKHGHSFEMTTNNDEDDAMTRALIMFANHSVSYIKKYNLTMPCNFTRKTQHNLVKEYGVFAEASSNKRKKKSNTSKTKKINKSRKSRKS